MLGDVVDTATAAGLALLGLRDLNAQCDRVGHLAHHGRRVAFGIFVILRCFAEAGAARFTSENVHVALASVKNDLLFGYGDTVKLLSLSGTQASFKAYTCIESYGDLIEAAIELYRFKIKAGPDDLGAFDFDARRLFYYLLTEAREIYPDILKAILVTAAVKNSVTVNTDVFCIVSMETVFIFSHGDIPSYML